MKDKKFEWLTDEICTEYQRRAKNLPENGLDTWKRLLVWQMMKKPKSV